MSASTPKSAQLRNLRIESNNLQLKLAIEGDAFVTSDVQEIATIRNTCSRLLAVLGRGRERKTSTE